MTSGDENSKWYTVAEACEYLTVSNSTLYTYMKNRRLPFFYLARTRQRRLRKNAIFNALLEPGNPDDPELSEADTP